MKKNIKRLIATVTVGLALVGAGGLTAFAAGYVTWGGTGDFEQTLANLNLISERGQDLKTSNRELKTNNEELKANNEELKTNNGNVNRELEQTRNQLLDKNNQIDALEQEIVALEKRLEGGQTTQDQLKQAEKDMEDVKNKSEQVLGEFN